MMLLMISMGHRNLCISAYPWYLTTIGLGMLHGGKGKDPLDAWLMDFVHEGLACAGTCLWDTCQSIGNTATDKQ